MFSENYDAAGSQKCVEMRTGEGDAFNCLVCVRRLDGHHQVLRLVVVDVEELKGAMGLQCWLSALLCIGTRELAADDFKSNQLQSGRRDLQGLKTCLSLPNSSIDDPQLEAR